uniref:F-box domain-containing protein n=1 Tax=Kryptolebias marmoratus TaxID=37003 RepID=A0A3Q3BCP6_KRYMA
MRGKNMPPSASSVHFPPEVWNHIFGYLSVSEKCSVRACCKYFKKLIDHWSLWKDWTVVLSYGNGPYSCRFWDTLRRRKVSSVVMRSTKAKHWSVLSGTLPALSSVVVEALSPQSESFNLTSGFPHLTRLALRNVSLLLDANMGSKLHRLTHLSMCGVTVKPNSDLFLCLPYLRSLTSLVCHNADLFRKGVRVVDTLVALLPELKHLSLSAKYTCPQVGGPGLGTASSLSSLELIDCSTRPLPEDTLSAIPSLKSLSVFYKSSLQESLEMSAGLASLRNWLGRLTKLSSLTVVKGLPVSSYVASIPAGVTSLALVVPGLSSKDLVAVATQVPNLLHLHIDPWPSHLGAHTARIPELFPKLRSLRLRQEHVPEEDFLCLHQLQDLQCLEILDRGRNLSGLIEKFQALTKHRVQVVTSSQRDMFVCPCVSLELSS